MKKITIGFSRPKGKICPCLSWGIRLFQGWTPYSHVYVKFHSNSLDRDVIYQASGLQVNYIGSKLFYKHVHVVDEFSLEISDEDYRKMMQYTVDNAGKPYSLKSIFAILFKIESWCDGDDSFVCSELIGEILRKYTDVSIDKSSEALTPKDIHRYLTSIKKAP